MLMNTILIRCVFFHDFAIFCVVFCVIRGMSRLCVVTDLSSAHSYFSYLASDPPRRSTPLNSGSSVVGPLKQ